MVYPTSQVIREQLNPVAGVIQATVGLDLNYVDRRIVDQFGPATVDFGGTFGVTVDLPLGVTLLQDIRPLKSGMSVTKNFYVANHPEDAAVAAAEWLTTMTTRISAALVVLRGYDTDTVLGTLTIAQV